MSALPESPPFLAFASDSQDLAALRQFAAAHQWLESCVVQGTVEDAAAYLKTHPAPKLLLVEIPSPAQAEAQLNALADGCDPDTKVIVIGNVNEYSFYCWLLDIGISSYLLRPLTPAALQGAYDKTLAPSAALGKDEKAPGKIIAVTGTRGGVGATTVAISLAAIIANATSKPTALIDLDAQEGSIALALDLEPCRGFREALEKPDRMDGLFIERVMAKATPFLSVLGAEESLQDKLPIHEHAGDNLLKEMRAKFDTVVLDVPRYMSGFSRQCLGKADHLVLVTEMTLLSLRDALRLQDFAREGLKMKQPMLVANRVGHSKYEVRQADFEKAVGAKLSHQIPYLPDVFLPPSQEIAVMKHKSTAGVKALYDLAAQLVPAAKEKGEKAKEKTGFNLLNFGAKKPALVKKG